MRWGLQSMCLAFLGLVMLGNGFYFPGVECANVLARQRLSRLYDWAWYQGDDAALLQFGRTHLELSNGDGEPLRHAVRRIGFRRAVDLHPALDARMAGSTLVFLQGLLPKIGRVQDALKLHHLLLAIRFSGLPHNRSSLWPELLATGALGAEGYKEWILADPERRKAMLRQSLAQIRALVSPLEASEVPD